MSCTTSGTIPPSARIASEAPPRAPRSPPASPSGRRRRRRRPAPRAPIPRSARSCARSGTWTDGAGTRARPGAGARARARRDARGGRRGRAPHGGRAGLDRRRLLSPGGAHGVGPVRRLAAVRGGGRARRRRARSDRPAMAPAASARGAPRRARSPRRPRRAARRHGARGVARGARPEPAPRLDRHAARGPPGRVRLRPPDQPHHRRASRRRGRDLHRRVQPVPQDHALAHDAPHLTLPVGARRRAMAEREAGARPQPRGAHPGRDPEERRLRHRRFHGRRAGRPGARLRPGLRPLHRERAAAARAALARAPSLAALLRLLPHLRRPRPLPPARRIHPPLRPRLPGTCARCHPPPARRGRDERGRVGRRLPALLGQRRPERPPRRALRRAPVRCGHPAHGHRDDSATPRSSRPARPRARHAGGLHLRPRRGVRRARAVPARRPLRRHGARAARAPLAGAAARRPQDREPRAPDRRHADHPGAARRVRAAVAAGAEPDTAPARRLREAGRRGRGERVQRRAALREPPPGRAQLHRRRAGGAPLRPRPRSGRAAERARDPPRGGGSDAGGAGALAPELPRAGTAARAARRHDRAERRDRAPAARARVHGVRRESSAGKHRRPPFVPMAVALIVAGGAVASWWLWRTAGLLPPQIETEELVEDLSLQLDPARLSAYFLVGDRARRALVAPPPSTFRVHAHVPEGGVLGFGVGVASAGHPDPGAANVHFSATVDGREVFSRVLGPGVRRRDRRWDDERIDLGAFVGREVEIALRTAVEGAGPAAGTPAWSNLAIVRRRSKERQLAGPDQPSVILLLVDTLRADRLGCYGANPSRTPRLDHLAGEGLLFENAIAQSSWTLPSIASIFTGLHMRSHGMVGGSGSAPAAPGGAGNGGFLPDSLLTLASHARLGGITTVGVSANPLVSRGTNLAHGFETFVEFPDDGPQTHWTPATKVNLQFVRWLRQNRRYRFFAYLHYMEPHAP